MNWFDEENKSFWDKWHREQNKNTPDYRFDVTPPIPQPPNRGKTGAEKEIARLEDLGDKNWSRDKDVLGFKSDKATEEAIRPKTWETSAEKESRQQYITKLRDEKIQELKDEERWSKLRLYGEANLRSNLSYSKDEERNALSSALGLEKDYNKALNDALTKSRKDGKLVDNETLRKLLDLEKKVKATKEAFLAGNFSFQYPSVTVRRTFQGDGDYAARFRGEADNLLFKVKSVMAHDRPGLFSGERHFDDGTVIKATSIVPVLGASPMDFIDIDVSRSTVTEEGCTCSITLINVPTIVQPMRYPEIIGEGKIVTGRGFVPVEIEGTDFIKTYYTVEVACPGSDPLDWNVCDTGENASDVGFQAGGTICKPFEYSIPSEPYHTDWTPPNFTDPPEPNNHCIYSLWNHCNAEILQTGHDAGGDYILWKAYTEWSNLGWEIVNFSRTGLGYMKLKAFIKDKSGNEVCSAEAIVKVDCCHKETNLRPLTLYWESFGTWIPSCVNQPFFFYAGSTWCEVPEITSVSYLANLYITHYVGFWVFSSWKGNCIPITWQLDGPGRLMLSNDTDQVEWFPPDWPGGGPDVRMLPCNEDIVITATDRCGTSDKVTALSCCKSNPEIEMLYTSLQMMCSASQDINASGACYPVTWTLAGGGTISYGNDDPGFPIITYNAPATNPDCSLNPTITVTDCCGKTASISLAVNCWYGNDIAIGNAAIICCSDVQSNPPSPFPDYHIFRDVSVQQYKCDGTLLSDCETNPGCVDYVQCNYPCTQRCSDLANYCWTNQCAGRCGGTDSDCGTGDCRTAAMLTGGCCPINPFTGLPY